MTAFGRRMRRRGLGRAAAAAEMHSGFGTLREICSMNCGVRVRLNGMPEALKRDIARLGEVWNDGLSRFGGPFLGGKAFTARRCVLRAGGVSRADI